MEVYVSDAVSGSNTEKHVRDVECSSQRGGKNRLMP
jgi:hypothetical protein